MAKFSIIIPVYNVAPYLRECLESVLAQSFTDWECICIDDGSTDDSGEILDAYAEKDARFRVFHQANAGVSATRNAGLQAAQGEWVWFVDGDDLIFPTALASIAQGIIAHPEVDGCVLELAMGVASPSFKEEEVRQSQVLSVKAYATFFRFYGSACLHLFKREALAGLEFQPYRFAEDTLFSLMAFFRLRAVLHVQGAPTYFYRLRDNASYKGCASMEQVRDWLLAYGEMRVALFEKGLIDRVEGGRERFFHFFVSQLYYTAYEFYFRASSQTRKACFHLWLKNLLAMRPYGKIPRRKAWVIGVLKMFPSPMLAKLLIYTPLKLYRFLRKGK
ncbi:MAG: glycosyltransferase family 2 protein [bacterium]|nr:glycosyltransferase family 2 protein [bacterium]